MTQITIDIPNQDDKYWVVQLLERLHLDYKISNDEPITNSEKTNTENNQAIIAKGSSMTMTEANEMLEWLKEQRQERTFPFRV